MNNKVIGSLVLGLAVGGVLGLVSVFAGNNSWINQPTSPKPPVAIAIAAPLEVEQKASGKQVSTVVLNESRTILIEGIILQNAVKAAQEIKKLSRTSKEPITILINSPGGSVFHGAALVSAMEASQAPVNTVCLGLCASMAAVIHQHGHSRQMVDRSVVMFHDAAGGAQGYLPHMLSRLNVVNRIVGKMSNAIAKKAGLTQEAFQALEHTELWLDAEDATARKFNDKIVSVHYDEAKVISFMADPEFKIRPVGVLPLEPSATPAKTTVLDFMWITE